MGTKQIGNFIYAKSSRKGKKLMTVSPNGRTLHFGAANMEHFSDKMRFCESGFIYILPRMLAKVFQKYSTNNLNSLTQATPL